MGATGNAGAAGGFAIVFQRSGDDWIQQDRLVPSNSSTTDFFGRELSLSSDGSLLAVVNSSGVTGNSVTVFARSGDTWTEEALIDDSSFNKNDVSLNGDGQTLAILDISDSVRLFSRAGGDWNPQSTVLEDKPLCCSLSLSDDGQTLAVGAHFDSSNAVGINGAEDNGLAPNAGAAYILTLQDGTWTQTAYLKASNAEGVDFSGDEFGHSIALDGDILVVGAPKESGDSNSTVANPNNNTDQAGAAYVFERTDNDWVQAAYLKSDNASQRSLFGSSVAIDGATIAVGSPGSNKVYLFTHSGEAWSQQASLVANNPGADDQFGISVDLDNDQVAIGANYDRGDANSTTDVPNISAPAAGAVYVFSRDGDSWNQQAYLKVNDAEVFEMLGSQVAIEGDTLVSAVHEYNGGALPGADYDADRVGAVCVFEKTGTEWHQQTCLTGSNTEKGDDFGNSFDIDGDTLLVGAYYEDGDPYSTALEPNDNATAAGAAYVFQRNDDIWTETSYLKAINAQGNEIFGYSVAVDGDTYVVGATQENGDANRIPTETPSLGNLAYQAGAVYVFP